MHAYQGGGNSRGSNYELGVVHITKSYKKTGDSKLGIPKHYLKIIISINNGAYLVHSGNFVGNSRTGSCAND